MITSMRSLLLCSCDVDPDRITVDVQAGKIMLSLNTACVESFNVRVCREFEATSGSASELKVSGPSVAKLRWQRVSLIIVGRASQ
jgi:hypothetical protein